MSEQLDITRIQLLTDSTGNLNTAANKIPLKGEPVVYLDSDSTKLKIGDGSKKLYELPILADTDITKVIDVTADAVTIKNNVKLDADKGLKIGNTSYSKSEITTNSSSFTLGCSTVLVGDGTAEVYNEVATYPVEDDTKVKDINYKYPAYGKEQIYVVLENVVSDNYVENITIKLNLSNSEGLTYTVSGIYTDSGLFVVEYDSGTRWGDVYIAGKTSYTVYSGGKNKALLSVGTGSGANAFAVIDDGRARIKTDPTQPNDVATKNYVDNSIANVVAEKIEGVLATKDYVDSSFATKTALEQLEQRVTDLGFKNGYIDLNTDVGDVATTPIFVRQGQFAKLIMHWYADGQQTIPNGTVIGKIKDQYKEFLPAIQGISGYCNCVLDFYYHPNGPFTEGYRPAKVTIKDTGDLVLTEVLQTDGSYLGYYIKEIDILNFGYQCKGVK